jgi:hypothetical protein
MVSSGLLRRVVLTRATRRNNPEDTILQCKVMFGDNVFIPWPVLLYIYLWA